MNLYHNGLQFFADGGDGGTAGEGTASVGVTDADTSSNANGNANEELFNIPASIPTKHREQYIRAMKRRGESAAPDEAKAQKTTVMTEQDTVTANGENTSESNESKAELSFAELIGNEKYKNEREAYMHNAFKDRFKMYESELRTKNQFLENLASEFGVDPKSETFMEDLEKAYSLDSRKVHEYAEAHDMPDEEAKKVLSMKRELTARKKNEEEQKIKESEEQKERQKQSLLSSLYSNAEKTKSKYESFDLAKEMQDENFRNLCAYFKGDTTKAYEAAHHEDIVASAIQKTANTAKKQIAQSVSNNKNRPIENGLGASVPSLSDINFRNMDIKQIRAFAEQMRKRR